MCSERGARRHSRGMTLVELILAIVVLGTGLAGVMMALSSTVRGSTDPLIQRQLLAIAEEMLEEIQLRAWAAAPNDAPAPCARDTWNDIADYDGYATAGRICTLDGTRLPALDGYSVAVTVRPAAFGGLPSTAAREIAVTASRGTDRLTLRGWRVDHAD